MNFKINFWKVRAYFYFKWMRRQVIEGISSRCQDGKHVLLLDYDKLPIEQVIQELNALQEMYKLSTFYVFKTNNGFHAICLDKVSLAEYKWIISDTCCDRNQWLVPMKAGNKTINLRTSAKDGISPAFLCEVSSKHAVREKSHAHLKYLMSAGAISKVKGVFDNYEKLLRCKYEV